MMDRRMSSGLPLERIATKRVEKPAVTKWRLSRFNCTENPATRHWLAPISRLGRLQIQMLMASLVGPCVHAQISNLQDSLGRLCRGRFSAVSSEDLKTPTSQLLDSANLLVKSAQATPGGSSPSPTPARVSGDGEHPMFPRTPCSSSTDFEKTISVPQPWYG